MRLAHRLMAFRFPVPVLHLAHFSAVHHGISPRAYFAGLAAFRLRTSRLAQRVCDDGVGSALAAALSASIIRMHADASTLSASIIWMLAGLIQVTPCREKVPVWYANSTKTKIGLLLAETTTAPRDQKHRARRGLSH